MLLDQAFTAWRRSSGQEVFSAVEAALLQPICLFVQSFGLADPSSISGRR